MATTATWCAVLLLLAVVLTAAVEGATRRPWVSTKDPRPHKGKGPCTKGPAGCRAVCAAEEGAGGHCNREGECICSGRYKTTRASTQDADGPDATTTETAWGWTDAEEDSTRPWYEDRDAEKTTAHDHPGSSHSTRHRDAGTTPFRTPSATTAHPGGAKSSPVTPPHSSTTSATSTPASSMTTHRPRTPPSTHSPASTSPHHRAKVPSRTRPSPASTSTSTTTQPPSETTL